MKKITSLVCAFALVASVMTPVQFYATAADYSPTQVFQMENMEISIEAEDMVSSSNMELVTDSDASGGKAMKVINGKDRGTPADSFIDDQPNPDLMVNINIPVTSTYKVWARVKNASEEKVNSPVWMRFDQWGKYVGLNYYPFPSESPTSEETKYLQYPYNYRLKFLNTVYTDYNYTKEVTGVTTSYSWILLNNASEYVSLGSSDQFRHGNEPAAVLQNGNRELALIFGDADTVIDKIHIVAVDSLRENDFDGPTESTDWKPGADEVNPSMTDDEITPYKIFPTDGVVPEFTMAGEHPRVFITADEIPAYKEKLQHPFFKSTYDNFVTLANQDINCLLPEENSDYEKNTALGDALRARALMYLIGEKDITHARKTVQELKNLLATATFERENDTTYNTRYRGFVMVTAALVYDWCYDAATDSDREYIIRRLKELSSETEVGWPPVRRGLLSSHPQEDLIYLNDAIVGIAIYDEDPQWYDTTMSVIFERMIPMRTWAAQSGYDYSVGSYFEARNRGALYLDKMLHVLGIMDEGETVFGDNYPSAFDHLIYRGLPNGVWFKDGDDYHWDSYAGYNKIIDTNVIPAYVGDVYGKSELLAEALQGYVWGNSKLGVTETFMFDPSTETKFMDELPTTYMSKFPMTTMVARTGWSQGVNSPDAMVYMNMHDVAVDGHQHGDVGSFQLWYKGMLALDSGYYKYEDHYYHYQSRSIAHNVLLVDNGNDDFYQINTKSDLNSTNDGGQKNTDLLAKSNHVKYMDNLNKFDESGNMTYGEYQLAYEKAHYIGPNEQTPAFSYISSDISGAYNYQNAKNDQTEPEKKIEDSGYERSMVFMDLYDETFPAAFIVYDNVTSLDADYKKTWLLHTEELPTIEGNTTTVVRTENGQNGKLVNTTLYPKANNADLTIVGGEGNEYTVNGTNWPTTAKIDNLQTDSGVYRVELSPATASADNIFLNAMYVTDEGTTATLPMDLVEDESNYVGVSVKDRIVTFSKDRDNISSQITLTVSNDYDTVYCLLTDMEAGKWKVTGNGSTIYVESKGDSAPLSFENPDGEYCLNFAVAPGTYTITPVDAADTNAVTVLGMDTVAKATYGDFRIRNNNNLMYLPKPNKLIDGNEDGTLDTYSAIEGVFTQLGALDVTKIPATDTTPATISFRVGTSTFTFAADSTTYSKGGIEQTTKLTCPPKMIDGVMYANLMDFRSILGFNTPAPSYDSTAKLLHINTNYEGGKLKDEN